MGPVRTTLKSGVVIAAVVVGAIAIAWFVLLGSDDGFVSEAVALSRPNVVARSGSMSSQYRIGSPPPDTTYDLRGLVSSASGGDTSFPLSFGDDRPGRNTIVVGPAVVGQQARDLTWEEAEEINGTALLLRGVGVLESFDLRADNVFDGFRPRTGSDPNGGRWLLQGCEMTWIRDDAVENDAPEMSGTIRDCLFDGVNTGVSIGQATSNAAATTRMFDSIFIFTPMPNDRADDGLGHQALFKQPPGGRVEISNILVCYGEVPISPERLEIWPRGTYRNVRIVLGSGFGGPYPGRLPSGVSISRDWSQCTAGAQSWRAAH